MTDINSLPLSLDLALETAVRDAILADAYLAKELNGVYDMQPVQAREPFVRIGDALVAPWSAKGFLGQEVRLAITIHDDRRLRERSARIGDRLSAVIDAMADDLQDARIVLKQMQRMRSGRSGATGWLVVTDWRFLIERI